MLQTYVSTEINVIKGFMDFVLCVVASMIDPFQSTATTSSEVRSETNNIVILVPKLKYLIAARLILHTIAPVHVPRVTQAITRLV